MADWPRVGDRHPVPMSDPNRGFLLPYASEVERMGERRAPLPACDRASPATTAFTGLRREVAVRLEAAGG